MLISIFQMPEKKTHPSSWSLCVRALISSFPSAARRSGPAKNTNTERTDGGNNLCQCYFSPPLVTASREVENANKNKTLVYNRTKVKHNQYHYRPWAGQALRVDVLVCIFLSLENEKYGPKRKHPQIIVGVQKGDGQKMLPTQSRKQIQIMHTVMR